MFNLSLPEFTVIALICVPIVLLMGVVLKKMGFSDLAAIGLAILMLTPLNWLVLAFLVFSKWPIQQELELLKRQVEEQTASANPVRPAPKSGASPLHVAIQKGYTDVVEALIAENVELNTKNAEGKTALQLAVDGGHDQIADLLRDHGATS